MNDLYKMIIVVVGIVCLTGMTCYAFSLGINGALFGTVATIIGTIIGYVFGITGKAE